ncbi:hypothetical protein [Guptibacillus hwajinpoensis]|uniref:Uncharacterized protein n=1 Tax=Guptibacillus hwajinpoensis TaxID=208199 RepID=A0A0J6CKJ0_9BACL|nr:hypothetical protein [Alkalihalobacillus macyae]KMM36756.1 hypothetical protein AB986_12510 [Alkalihalobacillus macyae]
MGVFDDLLYPDNKNRGNRASELGNDCAIITHELVEKKQTIDLLLQGANEAIKEAYQNIGQSAIPVKEVDIGNGEWITFVAEGLGSVVTYYGVTTALETAAKSFLLSEGRIGEAAFASLVGLPKWFNVGKVMGGIAAVVAVEMLIDAGMGAENRSNLRDAIHSLIPPRVTLKKSAMINEVVCISLQSAINAYDAVKNVPGLTPEQLDNILQNIIDQHKAKVDDITDDSAKAALQELDSSRGSWTNEDS